MDVGAAFVANHEAAKAGEPGEAAFDDPTMAAKALAILDAAAGDAGHDAALAAGLAARMAVIGLVGVEFPWASAWPARAATAEAGHSIEGWRQHLAVVAVGGAQGDTERRALGIGDDMAFGARPAAIRRVRTGLLAPLFAGTDALSSAARSQRMRPAASSRFSSK